MASKFAQERSNMENKIRNMKLKIVELENKSVMLMIEVDRLGAIVGELQKENEFIRSKSEEAVREADDLKFSLKNVEQENTVFKQAYEKEIKNEMV
jgi:hypothetical protein